MLDMPTNKKEYMRTYMRPYQKKRRADLREQGICVCCQKESAETGKTCCGRCLALKRANSRAKLIPDLQELFNRMTIEQNGRCSICKEYLTKPELDYDPETMEIRGVICGGCGKGLRLFKNNPVLVRAAALHLETSRTGLLFQRPTPSGA